MKLIISLLLLAALAVDAEYFIKPEQKGAKDAIEHPRYRNFLKKMNPMYGLNNFKSLTPDRRISCGTPANWGQFPYQALMFMLAPGVGWYLCGASFIKENWALTAAHCVYGFTDVDLYGGILDMVNGPAYFLAEVTNAAHKIMHEGYNDDTLVNDIAVIYLETAPSNLFENPYIGSIGLPCADENPLPGEVVTPSGFGRYNDTTSSEILRWTTAPIITNTQCANVFGAIVTAGNICIDTTGCRSTCGGDSGGPAAIVLNGRLVTVGVTSFGAAAGCTLGYPAAFARVPYFINWITQKSGVAPSGC